MEKWPEKFLLPCPFKTFTGFDCPGCGFQRSVLALFSGDFSKSFHLYPATLPILFLSAFLLLKMKFALDKRGKISRMLVVLTGFIVIIAYGFKLKGFFKIDLHSKTTTPASPLKNYNPALPFPKNVNHPKQN